MAIESSLNSRNEQLYMLEILVHDINLSSHKIRDEETSSLCVRAEIIDSDFKIKQEEFVFLKNTKDDLHLKTNCIDFEANKSYLYVELPSNIFDTINSKSLKIQVISKRHSQQKYLCETSIFFSELDGKKALSNFKNKLSLPIITKNIYFLIDHQGENTGTIQISLRLTFKKSTSLCSANLQSTLLPKITAVATATGSDSANRNLLTDIENFPVLEAPKAPAMAKLGDPEFENLTTAEMLNDKNYRTLIYQTYPNEPTCECRNSYSNRSSNCPSGCTSICCSSSRKLSKKKRRGYTVKEKRLRGGGEGIGNLENKHKFLDLNSNYTRNNSECNTRYYNEYNSEYLFNYKNGKSISLSHRLEGGGEEYNFNNQNTNPNIRATTLNDKQKDVCCCKDKAVLNSVMHRRSDQPAIKKPCVGIDCMIKAFQEAQEFVDSLGKVRGLADLGLMDPSESPYFGRNKQEGNEEPITAESKISNEAPPNPRSSTNCKNVCKPKSISTSKMPSRFGVIREVIPTLPDPNGSVLPGSKLKNKDDKTENQKEGEFSPQVIEETGPCGNSKCRSKKKKSVDVKGNGVPEGSNKKKLRSDNSKHYENSSGSIIKMARKITKFIYSAGDTYPGMSARHKDCVDQVPRVPPTKGWLWQPEVQLDRLKPRVGWKPGAINTNLRKVFHEVKKSFWLAGKSKSARAKSQNGSTIHITKNSRISSSLRKPRIKKHDEKKEEEWKEPPPTLHIQRKDGVYYVTMYPIKQDTMDVPKLEEPIKPLQFKIVKNKDNNSDTSISTASDMEIEFSPPAAVNRYRKKPDVIHVETQVKQQEILDANKPPGSKKSEKKSGKEKKAKK